MERFPESGWLEGAVEDIADVVRLVSVPQRAVNQASAILEEGHRAMRQSILDKMNEEKPRHHLMR